MKQDVQLFWKELLCSEKVPFIGKWKLKHTLDLLRNGSTLYEFHILFSFSALLWQVSQIQIWDQKPAGERKVVQLVCSINYVLFNTLS